MVVSIFASEVAVQLVPLHSRFQGYHFHPMTVGHGNASNKIGATPVFVAYPAEYRSSGS